MNALDSRFEALALNYFSYGFLTALNNMWAWLAVITAALSFWRIRALSSQLVPTPELRSSSQDAASTFSAPWKAAEMAAAAASTGSATLILSAPATISSGMLDREGSTKSKFRLYYEEDNFKEDDEGCETEDTGGGAAAVSEKSGRFYDDCERMMAMRMGDLGWYRWQDTTVLDGSVVRLWDRGRGRQAAALVVNGAVGW